jgi:hypothetical protein
MKKPEYEVSEDSYSGDDLAGSKDKKGSNT